MTAEPLPISLIAHTVFCPRRAWLEAAGETIPSVAIEAGQAAHARIDARADPRRMRHQSVPVHSDELNLVGVCDLALGVGEAVELIEYKSAPLRRRPEITHAQRIQLALQRLCLEENGTQVTAQSVYFTTHRKLVPVELLADDFAAAREFVAQTRHIISDKSAPAPLVDDPRCNRCSHAGVCLPDEHNYLVSDEGTNTRARVSVANPDGQVLHLTTPGARAAIQRGRVKVTRGEDVLGDLPVEMIVGLVVHGNVDLSTALIRELLWRGVSIVWCSGSGRVIGYSSSTRSANGLARQRQRLHSAQGNLLLAREFVASKIANQATQMRRSARDKHPKSVAALRNAARRALQAESVTELYGIEGDAAALYFSNFPAMMGGGADWFAARWVGREGRLALDPTNVALNFCYGLLLADVVRAVLACGLDPHDGFLHSSSRNKPALGLDLMEQFRPVVADSVVLGTINNGELQPSMFTDALGSTRLRDDGRRVLTAAYERRVQNRFQHPVFDYSVTWRRAMEVQARMVLGVLDGSQPSYVGIRTRCGTTPADNSSHMTSLTIGGDCESQLPYRGTATGSNTASSLSTPPQSRSHG